MNIYVYEVTFIHQCVIVVVQEVMGYFTFTLIIVSINKDIGRNKINCIGIEKNIL